MLERLRVLAGNPRLIPGVYNYCDRWCEHCPLTGRCLVFASVRERPTATVEEALGDAQTLLEELRALVEARLEVEEPSGADSDAGPGIEHEERPQHPLEFLARHYVHQAGGYLESLPSRPEPSSPPSPIEVVWWFHFQIAAKTRRALTSHEAAVSDPEMRSDALGSAKIALIGIDRSEEAWRTIAQSDGDARLTALIELLQAMRTGLELRFPEARAFIRPGLDEAVEG